MNIISFDIEEWYVEKQWQNRSDKYVDYDHCLDTILNKLEECKMKATFFCVGEMGHMFPDVIRKIHSYGHEIGCHSNIHTWLNKMTETECREDTHQAVDSLEQCVGEKVLSYRAPAFSIGESNKWALEILAENGIVRDASVFPAARDLGGFPNFGAKTPCMIEYNGIKLKEFPICTTKIWGKEIAYSGGGYFRLLPFWLIKNRMVNSAYTMCYFHISDIVPDFDKVLTNEEYEAYFKEPGTWIKRYLRYFKSNVGKNTTFDKMVSLVSSLNFVNLEQADKMINWENTPKVKL